MRRVKLRQGERPFARNAIQHANQLRNISAQALCHAPGVAASRVARVDGGAHVLDLGAQPVALCRIAQLDSAVRGAFGPYLVIPGRFTLGIFFAGAEHRKALCIHAVPAGFGVSH